MRRARGLLLVSCGGLVAACGLSIQGFGGAGDDDAGMPGSAPDSSNASPSDSTAPEGDADDRPPAADSATGDAADTPDAADAADADADDAADTPDAAGADAADAADAGGADADAGDARAPDADAAPLARTGLTFDGANDFVRMNRPVADDFTLEAWIRTTVSGSGPNFWDGPSVFHSDISGPNSDFGSSIHSGGKLAFGMGAPDLTVVGTTNVATGQWVHVAVSRVRSTGTVTLFVNGVQDGSRSGMSTASLGANPSMDIGANINNGHFFNGSIDEVRAWNFARTASQIQATMGRPLVGNEPGLVGYWRFDDGSGVTATDSSPTQAHGSLGNGSAGARPVWTPSTAF